MHFRDIGQDPAVHDVTYENGQARERTQILMDIANKEGGMVIGTGDHVGAGTWLGHLQRRPYVHVWRSMPPCRRRWCAIWCATTRIPAGMKKLGGGTAGCAGHAGQLRSCCRRRTERSPRRRKIWWDRTSFMISYLYHMLRLRLCSRTRCTVCAKVAFDGVYDDETILKWLKTFYRRFFAQQFKRSCLPDGPKVGSVAVSPRGDLRMPSDACAAVWLQQLEEIG